MGFANSPQEWFDVASERIEDAEAMLERRYSSNGPVYMAGFALECALNGYFHATMGHRPRPQPGKKSHDLMRQWREAGFLMRDLADNHGHKAWLLSNWGTHLRYDTEHSLPCSNEDMVKAAGQLKGYIVRRTKSNSRRRR